MDMLEHPLITKVNRTGYPEKEQSNHWGIDAMGDEIKFGDSIIEDPYGEVILEENLEDYLIERLGFVYKKAD
ncbi:YqaI family protein [Neobacillus sedimentimangrovi]|uniref:YqaI family protein n=1 Tax=Neobacillus sedimentimangrovi TaxID=2699460 RepID=UPI0013D3E733|nr:hypothetical protein [Neobacillus sedimentimangrovi]